MARTSEVAFLIALLGVAGCQKADSLRPVFPVSGTATYQGEPMAGALISFHPLDDPSPRALRSQATTDKMGRFQMTTYSAGDGAPAGEFAVTIYWPASRTNRKAVSSTEEEDMPPDRLGLRYAVSTTTRLRATVREQSNTIDFTLP